MSLSTHHPQSLLILLAILTLSFPIFYRFRRHANANHSATKIYELGGPHLFNASAFFSRRFDFMHSHFKRSNQKMFQFNILYHEIVAISGHAGRQFFFSDKSLDLSEGYKILMGAPRLTDINIETSNSTQFTKTLLRVLQRDRLADVIPTLFADLDRKLSQWGDRGRINPFKDVYDLVFQLTIRMATCRELAEDPHSVARLSKLYLDLEKSYTLLTLVLPWFPSPSRRAKDTATRGLFTLLAKFVDIRREADTPRSSDTIDLLIADGESNTDIIQFVLSTVFAGVINTGIMCCWVLLYLDANPKWKHKLSKEVSTLIATHSPSSTDPLHQRLSLIPLSAWEDEMPTLELVLRETIRLTLTGTALRRNVREDVVLYGKVLRKGAFMAYSIGDVHLDPAIYPDPYTFYPERFLREGDGKQPFSFLGWGAGRHPCVGMKAAKLQIKMIVTLIFAGYEYKLVDKAGNSPVPFPQLDRNDIQQARPLGEPCFLAYERVVP